MQLNSSRMCKSLGQGETGDATAFLELNEDLRIFVLHPGKIPTLPGVYLETGQNRVIAKRD